MTLSTALPNIIGLVGAAIAAIAYLPQIIHLVKEKCSAGISRRAYAMWMLSSVLITVNAFYIQSFVFIVLGIVQILSTTVIFLFSTVHKNEVCEFHRNSAATMP